MPIARLRTRELPSAERTELEAALCDPRRFHSDGREIMQAVVILPLLLVPLWFVLLNELFGPCRDYDGAGPVCSEVFAYLPAGIALLWQAETLELLGLVLIPLAVLGIVGYGLWTRGRHGYAITAFGVVRVRGTALRVLRYPDIAEIRERSRTPPQHRIVTDELELLDRDGAIMVMYGFGLQARRQLIEGHLARRDAGQ